MFLYMYLFRTHNLVILTSIFISGYIPKKHIQIGILTDLHHMILKGNCIVNILELGSMFRVDCEVVT